jgi:hypothetical protein
MKLLGFKKSSFLKDKLNIRPSMFMIPDEVMIGGSTVFFEHLVERLHHKDMVAICSLVIRKNTSPKLVCLVPQVQIT